MNNKINPWRRHNNLIYMHQTTEIQTTWSETERMGRSTVIVENLNILFSVLNTMGR